MSSPKDTTAEQAAGPRPDRPEDRVSEPERQRRRGRWAATGGAGTVAVTLN